MKLSIAVTQLVDNASSGRTTKQVQVNGYGQSVKSKKSKLQDIVVSFDATPETIETNNGLNSYPTNMNDKKV